MARRDVTHHRMPMSETVLSIANMVRRVLGVGSKGGSWQIEGYETDEELEGVDDDELVEAFTGVNVYARPSNDMEAIMVHVGGEAEHPVIVGARDEKARQNFVGSYGDLSDGDMAIHSSNGKAALIIKANGDIRIAAKENDAFVLVKDGGNIEVSSDGNTKLGDNASSLSTITDGFVHGTSSDPLTGFPQWVIGNSTRNVVGKK